MLDFSGESKKIRDFFYFFVKKEPFLPTPKGMGFPGLEFIMKLKVYVTKVHSVERLLSLEFPSL